MTDTIEMDYGYATAFRAVPGVTLEWLAEFGSYQGRMVAKIVKDGQTRYIVDYYGSCTGCDAFQAEFEYIEDNKTPEKLASFGEPYVTGAKTLDEALAELVGSEYKSDEDVEAANRILKDYGKQFSVLQNAVVSLPS